MQWLAMCDKDDYPRWVYVITGPCILVGLCLALLKKPIEWLMRLGADENGE